MAETLFLQTDARTAIGSKRVAKLRGTGQVPAVVYGHGKDPANVSLNLHDFSEALHHGHRLFETKLGDKKETLLVKDLQYDHLGKTIIHVDLMRVNLTETVRVMVPIEQRGTSKGSHFGGMVDEILDHIEIECRVSEIPDVLVVSIKELDVGESIHAGDIPLPTHARLITPAESVVLHCHPISKAKTTEELEEEMPLAPEVIGEEPEEGVEETAE